MIRLFIQQIYGKPVIIPDEADLQRLKAQAGDVLILDPSAVRVTPSTPETEHQIQIGQRVMEEYREVFEALARS